MPNNNLTRSDEETQAYFRGLKVGRLTVINAVKDILENSEQHISIVSILATLDRLEKELEALK